MPSQMTFNLIQGSVQFSFSVTAADHLKSELTGLVTTLKSIAAVRAEGGKVVAVKPMEYHHTGDIFLEVFCNPNIWPSPFAAKLLITVRDERIRLTTEAELTRIIEDVNLYLEQST